MLLRTLMISRAADSVLQNLEMTEHVLNSTMLLIDTRRTLMNDGTLANYSEIVRYQEHLGVTIKQNQWMMAFLLSIYTRLPPW